MKKFSRFSFAVIFCLSLITSFSKDVRAVEQSTDPVQAQIDSMSLEEKVGQLKRIVDAITEENISFGSVLVARYWDEGKRAVFPYLLTQNVAHIKKKMERLGFELLDPMEWYMDQLPKNE